MRWTLRYASHLGYRSPDSPLFRESVGSLDLVAHIRFAAELGFAGVQDAWVASRSAEEQRTLGKAMEQHGLKAVVSFTPRAKRSGSHSGRQADPPRVRASPLELTTAIEAARHIHARYLVVLSGALPNVPASLQFAAMVENLRWASDIAGIAGMNSVP